MTPFSALLAASGLSYAEAGAILGATKETVRDWARGKSRTPVDALEAIHNLVSQMLEKSDTLLDAYEELAKRHGSPDAIEIGMSTDDHEAKANGFVNLDHERATIGLAVAQLPLGAVKIVPRGSTVATVATAAAEGR